MRLGMNELIVILIIVIVILGPTQIPKLTKMFGKSVKSFKEGMDEAEAEAAPAEKSPSKERKAAAGKGSDAPDEEKE